MNESSATDRVKELEDTLRAVLTSIRPQGHASWELNTCLVTNEQVRAWWSVLGATPQWTEATGAD